MPQTATFLRFCKTMELRKGDLLIQAYKKGHTSGAAWPEITLGMKEVGILEMEIYLSGTMLFMIMYTAPDFGHAGSMAAWQQSPVKANESFICYGSRTRPAGVTRTTNGS